MAGVNRVILVGRLGKDVELRTSQSGKSVGKFSLATDTGWGDNKKTDWHNIVTFDRIAENCSKYIKKGSMVYVEGRISYNKWEKEPGNNITITSIVANEVQFLDTKGSGPSNYAAGGANYDDGFGDAAPNFGYSPASSDASAPVFDDGFNDKDVPF